MPESNATFIPIESLKEIPLIAPSNIKSWLESDYDLDSDIIESLLFCAQSPSIKTFSLDVSLVNTNELEPFTFNEGEFIFIDPDEDFRGRKYVAIQYDGTDNVSIKQVVERYIQLNAKEILLGVVVGRMVFI